MKEGKRSAELEDALLWLRDAGLVYQTELVEQPGSPLNFSANAGFFKVYMADVGLLCRKSGVWYQSILENSREQASVFYGVLAENYVQNQLISLGYKPYFWRSGNRRKWILS